MSLFAKLQQRAAEARPIRVALIGAGKFGSMYLAQVPRTPGVHLLGIADLAPDAARANLARVGWEPQRTRAASLADALKHGSTHIGEDWRALCGLGTDGALLVRPDQHVAWRADTMPSDPRAALAGAVATIVG